MSADLLPIEVVVTRPSEDDDLHHIVCHCTNDNTSACGLDVADLPFVEFSDYEDCYLCFLAWPDDAPTCPWGCSCEECGPD